MNTATSDSSIGAVMKWVGIIAAFLSLGTTLYGLGHAAGTLRDHKRMFNEQLTSGRREAAAGDFAAAWDSLLHAEAIAANEGFLAKILGGLGPEQRQIRVAEQDLAMQWLRDGTVPAGRPFSEITDKVIGTLTVGADAAAGPRKADLLAHLGWAYFLKRRSGDERLHPDDEYKAAVAVDSNNPFANVFWGHWILWNRGSLDEATRHFANALASGRALAVVRQFELSGLANSHSNDADAAWLRVICDMHAAGEPLTPSMIDDTANRFAAALHDDRLMQRVSAAIPPPKQIDLLQALLKLPEISEEQGIPLTVALAGALEAAGQPKEALSTYQGLASAFQSSRDSAWTDRTNEAIKRLSQTPSTGR